MVRFIDNLSPIEAVAKDLTNELRSINCKGLTVKITEDMKAMIDKYLNGILPTGSIRKALTYLNNQ